MTATARSESGRGRLDLYFPRQHGAWAMLAVPLLVGVVASGPSPWHVVLALAAVAGYMTVATAESWARARFSATYRPSLVLYGAVAVASGLAMAVAFPPLLIALAVVAPSTALSVEAGRSRRPRYVVQSLAQAAQAVALAPAAAWVGGASAVLAVRAGLLAAIYLVGTVLVVRSAIRERGNPRFAAVSIGFHLAGVAAAALVLGPACALLVAALAARSALVPVVDATRAHAGSRIRPVELGLMEIVASVAVVTVVALFGLGS